MIAIAFAVVVSVGAVSKGERALDAGQFDRALKLLSAEIAQTAGDGEAARLLLLEAICLNAQDRRAEAEAAVAGALQRDPLAAFPDARASPELLQLYERGRARVTGVLSVRSAEPAAIRVDGVDWGPAPTKIMLPVGRHTVELVAGEGRSAIAEAVVSSKAPVDLTLELPPAPPPAPVTAKREPEPKKADDVAPVARSARLVVSHEAPAPRSRTGPVLLLVSGVLLAGAGGAGIGWAWNVARDYQAGQQPGATPKVSREEAQRVQSLYPVAIAGAGLGAALALVGILWLALPDGAPAPTAWLTRDGAGFGLAASW